MARANWSLAPDDDAAEMYEAAMARLEAAAYRQYRDFERGAARARVSPQPEVLDRWRVARFGPGAHSTLAGVRWKNVGATEEYVSRVAAGAPLETDRRDLTADERWQEAVITGLRLQAGMSVGALAATYGVDLDRRFGPDLQRVHEAGVWNATGTGCG